MKRPLIAQARTKAERERRQARNRAIVAERRAVIKALLERMKAQAEDEQFVAERELVS